MNQEDMIADLIALLDEGCTQGLGHVNVSCGGEETWQKQVQTLGCPDCSATPLSCSVPTLHEGMDRKEE